MKSGLAKAMKRSSRLFSCCREPAVAASRYRRGRTRLGAASVSTVTFTV
jgi:hypothetical protein